MNNPVPLSVVPAMTGAQVLQQRFDQAAARLPAELIELMARAAYEESRPPGSGRPEWARCEEAWRTACRLQMAAALVAAEAAGHRLVRG